MKKYLLALTVLILGLTLVACKPRYEPIINKDDFDKSWTFDNTIETTVTFAHTMGKTTDPALGQQALLDKQKDAFIKEMQTEFGWKVNVVHSQYGGFTELHDKLSKELAQGIEPSMAYAYPDHVAAYIASDKVLPLDNLIDNNDKRIAFSKEDKNDYVDSFMEEGRKYDHAGTTLSVPFSKSTEVLFYNKTFFDKHNLTLPQTWDELNTLSEQMKKLPGLPAGFRPFAYDSDDNLFIVRSAQKGLPYTKLDEKLNGEAVFDTSQSQAMVKDLQDMYKKGNITTKGMIGGYTSDMFVKGALAMTVGSTGGTTHNVPSDGSFEVGIAPMPQETKDVKKHQTILQGPSIVLFRKGIRPATEQNEDGSFDWVQPKPTQAQINEMVASWMFYKYITRAENTIDQAIGTGYLPVRNSAFDTQKYKDYIATEHTKKADKAKADVLQLAKQLMNDDVFFVSPAYPTSAKARIAVGNLLMEAFAEKGTIDRLFKKAIAASS